MPRMCDNVELKFWEKDGSGFSNMSAQVRFRSPQLHQSFLFEVALGDVNQWSYCTCGLPEGGSATAVRHPHRRDI